MASDLEIEGLENHLQSSLFTAQQDIAKWRDYEKDYDDLIDLLKELPKKIKHDVMVPFGKLAFMPGQITKTNEVTVLLGDNWFMKRSAHDAVGIAERRNAFVKENIAKLESSTNELEKKIGLTKDLRPVSAGNVVERMGTNEEGLDFFEIREEFNEADEQNFTQARSGAKGKEVEKPQKASKSIKELWNDPEFQSLMDKLQLAEENELAPKFLEAGREKIDSGPKDLIERLEIPTPFEEGVPFEKVTPLSTTRTDLDSQSSVSTRTSATVSSTSSSTKPVSLFAQMKARTQTAQTVIAQQQSQSLSQSNLKQKALTETVKERPNTPSSNSLKNATAAYGQKLSVAPQAKASLFKQARQQKEQQLIAASPDDEGARYVWPDVAEKPQPQQQQLKQQKQQKTQEKPQQKTNNNNQLQQQQGKAKSQPITQSSKPKYVPPHQNKLQLQKYVPPLFTAPIPQPQRNSKSNVKTNNNNNLKNINQKAVILRKEKPNPKAQFSKLSIADIRKQATSWWEKESIGLDFDGFTSLKIQINLKSKSQPQPQQQLQQTTKKQNTNNSNKRQQNLKLTPQGPNGHDSKKHVHSGATLDKIHLEPQSPWEQTGLELDQFNQLKVDLSKQQTKQQPQQQQARSKPQQQQVVQPQQQKASTQPTKSVRITSPTAKDSPNHATTKLTLSDIRKLPLLTWEQSGLDWDTFVNLKITLRPQTSSGKDQKLQQQQTRPKQQQKVTEPQQLQQQTVHKKAELTIEPKQQSNKKTHNDKSSSIVSPVQQSNRKHAQNLKLTSYLDIFELLADTKPAKSPTGDERTRKTRKN